jgi:hypothetical protein
MGSLARQSVGFLPCSQKYTTVQVTAIDKHCSLLRYVVNCVRKSFILLDLGLYHKTYHSRNLHFPY